MPSLIWLCLVCVALALPAATAEGGPFRPLRLRSQVTRVQPMTGIVMWEDSENKGEGSAMGSFPARVGPDGQDAIGLQRRGDSGVMAPRSKEGVRMRRACWVALVVALIAVVTGSVLYGQAGGGAPAPAGDAAVAPGGGPATGMMSAERMKAMLDRLDLTAEDRAAVEKSLPVMLKARQALQDELGKLRTVAYDTTATPEQITQAIERYMEARSKYREATRPENRALSEKLSPRGRARCLVAGILDNGLGFGGGPRMGMGGRPGGGQGGAAREGAPQ